MHILWWKIFIRGRLLWFDTRLTSFDGKKMFRLFLMIDRCFWMKLQVLLYLCGDQPSMKFIEVLMVWQFLRWFLKNILAGHFWGRNCRNWQIFLWQRTLLAWTMEWIRICWKITFMKCRILIYTRTIMKSILVSFFIRVVSVTEQIVPWNLFLLRMTGLVGKTSNNLFLVTEPHISPKPLQRKK